MITEEGNKRTSGAAALRFPLGDGKGLEALHSTPGWTHDPLDIACGHIVDIKVGPAPHCDDLSAPICKSSLVHWAVLQEDALYPRITYTIHLVDKADPI